ncbi:MULTISPECIES: hypothetical protein [unclassified Streptomyces]|uniref:hypothetical protein n=1 Tax=unclassified Streptomyces TaxID=2593676 RepID=UPI001F2E0AEA|nr:MULTISPECIES: hypothetical protein [unclassified Streptomyces]MCU4744847.1 hypothetical protein [Streptomyces sp. G-5]
MSGRTALMTNPRHRATAGSDIRLRWWALALPVAAFSALLFLLAASAQADASGGPQPVSQLVEHARSNWLG